ncbi:MAG: helix-turn-helix domain-containing protein [Intestinibacter bartlettii]|nr:helix-turn-helix domain-containing protein [Intestinibacter bartlettii]
MYINMNEILDKFSQFTSSYKISFDTEIVNFKFSTKNLQNYSPYCLYIFRANKLPKEIFNYNKINFLIIGEPQDLPYLNRCNYIILKEDSISIFDIIKIIQSLLNFDDALSSFKEKLFYSIKDDLSISNMISIAFEYLNNPIMVLNSKYETCYFELGKTVLNEPVWEFQIKNNRPHPEYSLKYNKSRENRLIAESSYNHVITFFEGLMNHREIAIPIKHIDFSIGRICVLEVNRDITQSDIHILKTLAKMMYPLMISDKKFLNLETSRFDYVLSDLMNNPKPNMLLMRKKLSNFKFDLDSNMYLLCLCDLDNINSKSKVNYVKQMVQGIFEKHYVFVFDKNIIVLYNNKNSFDYFKKCKEYEEFLEFIKNYTLSVGVSKLFDGISGIRNAYFESLSAINFANRLNCIYSKEPSINFYDDYVLHDLVYDFVAKKKLHYILDSTIINLLADNNTNLISTVKCYLDCGENLNFISDKLGIHYNTLKYRINKLKTKYFIDLKNPDSLVKLKLAIIALEISKGYDLDLGLN